MLLKAILLLVFAIIVLVVLSWTMAAEKADVNIDIMQHTGFCDGECKECDIEDTCKIKD